MPQGRPIARLGDGHVHDRAAVPGERDVDDSGQPQRAAPREFGLPQRRFEEDDQGLPAVGLDGHAGDVMHHHPALTQVHLNVESLQWLLLMQFLEPRAIRPQARAIRPQARVIRPQARAIRAQPRVVRLRPRSVGPQPQVVRPQPRRLYRPGGAGTGQPLSPVGSSTSYPDHRVESSSLVGGPRPTRTWRGLSTRGPGPACERT